MVWEDVQQSLCCYFDEYGYVDVQIEIQVVVFVMCFDFDDVWVCLVIGLLQEISGKFVIILFNLGGIIFNYCFLEVLGLLMFWMLYFYFFCLQYVLDEYLLVLVVCEGL